MHSIAAAQVSGNFVITISSVAKPRGLRFAKVFYKFLTKA